jgi:hypothetical protein
VEPVPVEPVPVEPVPVEPVPVEPVPVEPVPVEPVPVEPVPVEPVPVEPVPAAPLLGGFTLNWTAPTTRADGTPLSLADIDGYRIYFGNSPGNYSDVIEVADGTAQSVNVTDLSVGTYYLVMTTYDSAGLESIYSGEISKMAQ